MTNSNLQLKQIYLPLNETQQEWLAGQNELTQSENEVLRLILAFVRLPGSRLKLTESEQQALKSAQDKLNSQSW